MAVLSFDILSFDILQQIKNNNTLHFFWFLRFEFGQPLRNKLIFQ